MNFDNPLLVSELERRAYLAGDSETVELLSELVNSQSTISECDEALEMFGMEREAKKPLTEQAVSFMEVHNSYRRALFEIQHIMYDAHLDNEEKLNKIDTLMDKVDVDGY